MKPIPARKMMRFYVINPKTDRRSAERFEATENVVIKGDRGEGVTPGVIYDFGEKGLRLVSKLDFNSGSNIQISFPNTPDHVQCYGRVSWSKSGSNAGEFEMGVLVDEWYGITEGSNSWKRFKGTFAKKDRRSRPR